MDRLRGLLARWRFLWRSRAEERDLDDELRLHIELETEAGMRQGLSHDEARRRALVAFGGVTQYREATRDTRRLAWVDEALADLRQAWRLLAARPAFAATIILTLALGIGANTAIVSVIDAVLLRPSPFADPDRLVMVWETDRGSGTRHEPASWPDVADFRQRSRTLSAIGTMMGRDATLGGTEPVRVAALAVTPDLPVLLGVRALAGRLFLSTDGMPGAQPTALLGEDLWRAKFNADPSIIGRTIPIDERPTLIVGVLPAEADLGIRQVAARADYGARFRGAHVDLWLALQPTAASYPRDTHPFLTLGRLAPGATASAAQREMAGIAEDLERTHRENDKRGVNIEPYSDVVFGAVRPALYILFGAVTLVLLVTCVNVANLLLARTATRAREVAVRVALGAARGRIARQFLTESVVLVTLGSAAGVVLAGLGLRLIVALAPGDMPRLDAARVNGAVLAYTATVAALVALVFGMLPVSQTRRLDLQDTLKSDARHLGAGGRRARRVRSALVVAEVALTVILVVSAGLLLRSLWLLERVDPGFDPAHVLEARYELPTTRYPIDFRRYPDIPAVNGFHARFLEAVRALPGVQAAALSLDSPLDPGFTNSFTIVGREAESADFPEIRTRFLTPGYLETLGVPLLAGRGIEPGDDAHAPLVIVINRAAARRYFADRDPIGQQLRFWGMTRRIVGVIGDERFRGLHAAAEPAVYAPLAQSPQQSATLLVRTAGADPAALIPAIQSALHGVDPRIALFDARPLQQRLASSIARPRFHAALLALFAGITLVLAIVGVYGVLSYSVTERASEMGLRMALGASRWTVMRGVLRTGLQLAGAGLVIGVAVALIGSRLLSTLVFGVTPTDPLTFAGVIAVVVFTAAAASLIPAVRATRADPMTALRGDPAGR